MTRAFSSRSTSTDQSESTNSKATTTTQTKEIRTGLNVGSGQLSGHTEVDADEFTLDSDKKKSSKIIEHFFFLIERKYLRNGTSCRYGWSWRCRRPRAPDWSARFDLPECPANRRREFFFCGQDSLTGRIGFVVCLFVCLFQADQRAVSDNFVSKFISGGCSKMETCVGVRVRGRCLAGEKKKKSCVFAGSFLLLFCCFFFHPAHRIVE